MKKLVLYAILSSSLLIWGCGSATNTSAPAQVGDQIENPSNAGHAPFQDQE